MEQSIGESKDLSDSERASLIQAVYGHLRLHKRKDESEQMSQDEASQSRVKAIDVSELGTERVFVVQGSGRNECSPTGNCSLWIFRGGPRGFTLVLDGTAQAFWVLPTTTNGFHDVILGMHGSATMQGLKVYRFDRSTYRRSGCYEENWEYLGEDGETHQLNEPRITPCGKRE